MEQLEYQLQRDNEATRQQINKAIADRCGVCLCFVYLNTIELAAWMLDSQVHSLICFCNRVVAVGSPYA